MGSWELPAVVAFLTAGFLLVIVLSNRTGGIGQLEGGWAVRELDKAAADEIASAFRDNPVAARQRYASVRWRFSGQVDSISGPNYCQITCPFGPAAVTFEPGHVESLRNGGRSRITAVLEDLGTNFADRTNARFKSGRVEAADATKADSSH